MGFFRATRPCRPASASRLLTVERLKFMPVIFPKSAWRWEAVLKGERFDIRVIRESWVSVVSLGQPGLGCSSTVSSRNFARHDRTVCSLCCIRRPISRLEKPASLSAMIWPFSMSVRWVYSFELDMLQCISALESLSRWHTRIQDWNDADSASYASYMRVLAARARHYVFFPPIWNARIGWDTPLCLFADWIFHHFSPFLTNKRSHYLFILNNAWTSESLFKVMLDRK